ncbi:MBL fold metallo-hydrolase [Propylenella binzhouense]|nr:MBL fold metallo-hydrolase [Propylenella binzhouense]
MNVAPADLHYPFAPPEFGEVVAIAPGLLWTRLALPFALDHLNVFILDDGDGWTVVDCGAATAETEAAWRKLLDGPLAGRPVSRLVATHGHTDHVGFAGPLTALLDAPFLSSRSEWTSAVIRRLETVEGLRGPAGRFYESHGCPDALVEGFLAERARSASLIAEMPPAFVRIAEGDVLAFGGRRWRVMIFGGHAQEHCVFWSESDRIMIAGDQILPRITPQIGVNYSEPEADPLTEFLASLRVLGSFDEDVLVLPGHGLPYRGPGIRARQLEAHHASRLAAIATACDGEPTTFDVAIRLFPQAMRKAHARFAVAETLAHLNHLVGTGRLARSRAADGRIRFRPSR